MTNEVDDIIPAPPRCGVEVVYEKYGGSIQGIGYCPTAEGGCLVDWLNKNDFKILEVNGNCPKATSYRISRPAAGNN